MLLILQNLFLHAIFAAIPAVGFAMLFNVPKSALKYCAMGGAIVYTCREFFMTLHLTIELSTFLASVIIGIIALYWSKKNLVPRPIYTVA
ncbi:MAG: threonine/serine exporter family protein, partial [Arcobacter sp.]